MHSADEMTQFDALATLAQNDPEAFEAERRRLLEEFMQEVPERHHRRLHGLQFRIDMERRRAKTPVSACLRISAMMWESFGKLQTSLQELSRGNSDPHLLRPSQSRAEVLSFQLPDDKKQSAS